MAISSSSMTHQNRILLLMLSQGTKPNAIQSPQSLTKHGVILFLVQESDSYKARIIFNDILN